MDEEGGKQGRAGDDALDELLLAPAGVLEGLPDAVVASAADGRIVYVNAARRGAVRLPAPASWSAARSSALWPERVRDRYTRNMQLYFATEHPLRFSTEVWGLRRTAPSSSAR